MKLSRLIVPFEDDQNEKLVDLWVQLISNTQISDIDIVIANSGTSLVLIQTWSITLYIFNSKVLLRPFKDKKVKRLYGKDSTYTTAYKNVVNSLKGEPYNNSRSTRSNHPSLFNLFFSSHHEMCIGSQLNSLSTTITSFVVPAYRVITALTTKSASRTNSSLPLTILTEIVVMNGTQTVVISMTLTHPRKSKKVYKKNKQSQVCPY